MAKHTKPLAAAVGAAFLASVAISPVLSAADNPFQLNELSSGYKVADAAEGKCGEGKCGESKKAEKEGNCGESKAEKEGSCGESKAEKEGSCGESKADSEGESGK